MCWKVKVRDILLKTLPILVLTVLMNVGHAHGRMVETHCTSGGCSSPQVVGCCQISPTSYLVEIPIPESSEPPVVAYLRDDW